MPRRQITGARTIVTGASSGIGRALAKTLADAGARVIVIARREESLRGLQNEICSTGETCKFVVGDVTDAPSRAALIAVAQQEFGGLDVLVNNAGIGALGRFDESDAEQLRRVMEVNFFAAVELTRAALPLLKASRGLLVNIGSILGHRGVPYSSAYCASKFALRGFSEAVRAELAADGVGVLVVSPGTTETEFFDHTIADRKRPPWPEQRGVPPEYVAAETVRAIRSGRNEIVPNARGRWMLRLNRHFPRLMDAILSRYGGRAEDQS